MRRAGTVPPAQGQDWRRHRVCLHRARAARASLDDRLRVHRDERGARGDPPREDRRARGVRRGRPDRLHGRDEVEAELPELGPARARADAAAAREEVRGLAGIRSRHSELGDLGPRERALGEDDLSPRAFGRRIDRVDVAVFVRRVSAREGRAEVGGLSVRAEARARVREDEAAVLAAEVHAPEEAAVRRTHPFHESGLSVRRLSGQRHDRVVGAHDGAVEDAAVEVRRELGAARGVEHGEEGEIADVVEPPVGADVGRRARVQRELEERPAKSSVRRERRHPSVVADVGEAVGPDRGLAPAAREDRRHGAARRIDAREPVVRVEVHLVARAVRIRTEDELLIVDDQAPVRLGSVPAQPSVRREGEDAEAFRADGVDVAVRPDLRSERDERLGILLVDPPDRAVRIDRGDLVLVARVDGSVDGDVDSLAPGAGDDPEKSAVRPESVEVPSDVHEIHRAVERDGRTDGDVRRVRAESPPHAPRRAARGDVEGGRPARAGGGHDLDADGPESRLLRNVGRDLRVGPARHEGRAGIDENEPRAPLGPEVRSEDAEPPAPLDRRIREAVDPRRGLRQDGRRRERRTEHERDGNTQERTSNAEVAEEGERDGWHGVPRLSVRAASGAVGPASKIETRGIRTWNDRVAISDRSQSASSASRTPRRFPPDSGILRAGISAPSRARGNSPARPAPPGVGRCVRRGRRARSSKFRAEPGRRGAGFRRIRGAGYRR